MHQLRISFICTCGVSLFATSFTLAAQITPVSQHRTIMGDSNVVGPPSPQQDIQEVAAANFDQFEETLVTAASSPNSATNADSFQQSSIDSCTLTAAGGFESFAQNTPPGVLAYSVGSSVYQVTFSLDAPATCRIVGSISATDAVQSRVILQQQSTGIVNLTASNSTMAVAEQRSLAAGQYTLTMQSIGTAFVQNRGTHSASGSYEAKFSICFNVADLNIDGVVNIDDLLSVIGAWGPCSSPAGECLADITADDVVNVDDLLTLINSWG